MTHPFGPDFKGWFLLSADGATEAAIVIRPEAPLWFRGRYLEWRRSWKKTPEQVRELLETFDIEPPPGAEVQTIQYMKECGPILERMADGTVDDVLVLGLTEREATVVLRDWIVRDDHNFIPQFPLAFIDSIFVRTSGPEDIAVWRLNAGDIETISNALARVVRDEVTGDDVDSYMLFPWGIEGDSWVLPDPTKVAEALERLAGDPGRYADPKWDFTRRVCEKFAGPMAEFLRGTGKKQAAMVIKF
jgi:hypothetical protein